MDNSLGEEAANTLIGAVRAAQDRDTLRETFLRAVDAANIKYLGVMRWWIAADGTPAVAPVLEQLPVGVTLDNLSVRWPISRIFFESANGKSPFEIDAGNYKQVLGTAQSVFVEVSRVIGLDHCLLIPIHREGILRGGAFFWANKSFSAGEAAFLRALCEAGHERLNALGLLPELNPLTTRQREALSLCAHGKSDWEIAQLLNISPATAHEHIEAVKRKLGVRTRVQAAVLAAQKGWI